MIVSINQPAYFPWLGYFDRIAKSDLHIVLDSVPFSKGSFQNRNRIRHPDGTVAWLTLPVEKGKLICETRIVGEHWRRKHARTLELAYGIEVPFPRGSSLPMVCRCSTMFLRAGLIRKGLLPARWTPRLFSSRMKARGNKSALILALCQEVGATIYLSGSLGRDYLDLAAFEQAGIEVRYHDFEASDDPPLSAIHDVFGKERQHGNRPFAC